MGPENMDMEMTPENFETVETKLVNATFFEELKSLIESNNFSIQYSSELLNRKC